MSNVLSQTGILRDVRRCYIDDSSISFLFGYVVEHQSTQYSTGDWFATSYIREVKVKNGKYYFHTANSVYRADGYASLIVADDCLDRIRMGLKPEIATSGNTSRDLMAVIRLNQSVSGWAQKYDLSIDQVFNVITSYSDELFKDSQ